MKQVLITITAVVLVGCANQDVKIIQAVKDGNVEAVKKYLAAGMDVNTKDGYGATPLLYAAEYGYNDVAELLITNGAAYNGHTKIAELLLSKGANVNWNDEFGSTPLQYATDRGHKETIALLRKNGGKTGEELKAEGK